MDEIEFVYADRTDCDRRMQERLPFSAASAAEIGKRIPW